LQTQLEVVAQNEDRKAGMWTFTVRVVVGMDSGNSETGPETVIGISNASLNDLYGGDAEKYLLSIKDELVRDFEVARALRAKVGTLKGRRL
jgi:hypothetical protein